MTERSCVLYHITLHTLIYNYFITDISRHFNNHFQEGNISSITGYSAQSWAATVLNVDFCAYAVAGGEFLQLCAAPENIFWTCAIDSYVYIAALSVSVCTHLLLNHCSYILCMLIPLFSEKSLQNPRSGNWLLVCNVIEKPERVCSCIFVCAW